MNNKFSVAFKSVFSTVVTAVMLAATPAQAQTEASILSDDWQFDAQVYIWAADFAGDIDGPLGGTVPFDIPFDTLVDNLKMGFYGSFEARKAKWLVFTDIVYLNIEANEVNTPLPPTSGRIEFQNLKMEGSVINLIGGYNLLAKGRTRVDFIAGVRYLDLGSELNFNVTLINNTAHSLTIPMGTALDGIVGVKGKYAFADRWSIPYHVDIGAGDSDLTWQVWTGVSYQAATWVDVALTYRHMEWDLKSTDGAVNNVNFNGPAVGATFHF